MNTENKTRHYFIIRSRLNNLRLDVASRRKETGAEVTMWLAKNWSDQLWYEDMETGTIRWKRNDYCLELEGDVVIVNPYSHGNVSQLWHHDGRTIRHRLNSYQVVCVAENSLMPGSKVRVHGEMGEPGEQFEAVFVPGLNSPYERRSFYIVSEVNSKVLDIKRERSAAGTDVIIWSKKKHPAKNQLWYFDTRGVIRSALNDLVIEAQYGSAAKMVGYERVPCQEWTYVDQGIISKTGECLELFEDQSHDGANVFSSKFYDTLNQRWRLEYQ